jgi:hypothetical protein
MAAGGTLVVTDKDTDRSDITDGVALGFHRLNGEHRRTKDAHVSSIGAYTEHSLKRGDM